MGNNIDFDTRFNTIMQNNNIGITRMFNFERKIEHIASVYSNNSDTSLVQIIRLFSMFGEEEHRLGKDMSEFSEKEFIDYLKRISFNNGTFSVRKSTIRRYLRWCYDKKIIDSNDIIRKVEDIGTESISKYQTYERSFFDSFSKLYDAMEKRLKMMGSKTYKDQNMYAPYAVAIYLAWYGVKLTDVVEIKVSDIDIKNNVITISSTGEQIKIQPIVMGMVERCINSPDYVQGEYLIRTNQREKIKHNELSSLISKYFGKSEELDGAGQKFINYTKVYWSGVFQRAYEREISDGYQYSIKDERSREVFLETAEPYVAKRLREYRSYCEYFFPDRINLPKSPNK